MVEAIANDTDQLMTSVDNFQTHSLVVTPVPLLCAAFHLHMVVGSQGQTLQTTTGSNQTGNHKVLEGQLIKESLQAA